MAPIPATQSFRGNEGDGVTKVDVKAILEQYAALEMNAMVAIQGETARETEAMKAAIARNQMITSTEATTRLEDNLNIITILNLKMQLDNQKRIDNYDKLKEKVDRLPNPPKPIEELRKEKHYLILNHTKIVQEQFEEARKTRKIEQEEKEKQQLTKLQQDIEKVESEAALIERKTSLCGRSNDSSSSTDASVEDSGQEIEMVTEVPAPGRVKQWEVCLKALIKEIETKKTSHDTMLDQVVRLNNRLAELEKNSPSTSKVSVKVEHDKTSPGNRVKPKTEKVTPEREKTSSKGSKSKVAPKTEKLTPKSAVLEAKKKRPSEDVVELSD